MALVALNELKTFLQISTTANDTVLTLYLDLVSSEVSAFVNRNLEETFYTDEVLHYVRSDFDIDDLRALSVNEPHPQVFVQNYPVIGSLSLSYDGETVSTDDYTINAQNGVITFYRFVRDYKDRLTTSYTAGYTSVTGAANTTPNDLRLVVMDGVKRMFQSSGTVTPGQGNVKSKKIKDFSVSYGNNLDSSVVVESNSYGLLKGYLAANHSILQKYMRVDL